MAIRSVRGVLSQPPTSAAAERARHTAVAVRRQVAGMEHIGWLFIDLPVMNLPVMDLPVMDLPVGPGCTRKDSAWIPRRPGSADTAVRCETAPARCPSSPDHSTLSGGSRPW